MKKTVNHKVEQKNNIQGDSNNKDRLSLPFHDKKDKIKSSEPIKKHKLENKSLLHKKSLLNPPSDTNKLKAIINEENGVREAIKKGKAKGIDHDSKD